MATIILEVLDRVMAIPLIEAALEREVAHLEMAILKTRRRLSVVRDAHRQSWRAHAEIEC